MSASKGNLLLIDDEEILIERLELILEDYADNVFKAYTGKQGLDAVKENKIHCIICDINMPELNGVDFIKLFREFDTDTPVIFYTGHGSNELMLEVAKYGTFDFLNKPNLDGLEEAVERGLKLGIDIETGRVNSQSGPISNEDYQSILSELRSKDSDK